MFQINATFTHLLFTALQIYRSVSQKTINTGIMKTKQINFVLNPIYIHFLCMFNITNISRYLTFSNYTNWLDLLAITASTLLFYLLATCRGKENRGTSAANATSKRFVDRKGSKMLPMMFIWCSSPRWNFFQTIGLSNMSNSYVLNSQSISSDWPWLTTNTWLSDVIVTALPAVGTV